MKKLRIAAIASEVAPFSKTGGLSDVARSLPKSLKRLGHDVIVITPLYKRIIDINKYKLKKIYNDVPLTFHKGRKLTVSFYQGELMRGLKVYFVSCDKYFGRKKWPYGSDHENKRFYILDVAVLKLLLLLKFKADIIHCHDWHAGLIPELLKKQFKLSKTLQKAATVFTIHNLTFQFGTNWWDIPGPKRDNGTDALPDFNNNKKLERINFAKRGILHADVVNTVSETYAEEILERNFGQGLQRILQNRKEKLFGVVNGIDYDEFNPEKDKTISVRYTYKKFLRKNLNKKDLQKRYNLHKDENAFVITMTSRIAEQKGFDILLPSIEPLLHYNIQFVFMGDGDKEYIKQINKLKRQYPHQIALTSFDKNKSKETMLYAGGDVAIIPSRFEPCGINQLKSMRYGCVPIARAIGGLSDTVDDFNNKTNQGNGFVFNKYDSKSLLIAVTRAYSHFQHRRAWRNLAVRGMKQSNSWELPAKKYVDLYKQALKLKNEKN